MPSIQNPRLQIIADKRNKTAACTVDCTVALSKDELSHLDACPVKLQLDCALWGQDTPDPDDFLYQFPAKLLPDGKGAAKISAKFSTSVAFSVLDEDWGSDEIYARLHLTDQCTHKAVAANSNVVTGSF